MPINITLPPVLMIMICMRCRLGGAEKRYARIFEMLANQTASQHKLLVNRAMLNLLQEAGILKGYSSQIIVLQPPYRRFLESKTVKLPAFLRRTLNITAWGLDALWYIVRCRKTFYTYKPSIVHPLLTGMYLSLPALLAHPEIRLLMSAYTAQYYRDKFIFGIGLGAMLKRFSFQRSQAIDALSYSIRDNLTAQGINSKKIQVAPGSFTDFSLCHPNPKKKKWIVFTARFTEHKNPLLLAQAIPTVLKKYPETRFYFLGKGELKDDLEALVLKFNIANQVTIKFEPHPTKILNQSSIFVSLQDKENYPSQSLLEAMACGNAIVATDVGETWRLVDESNGIRVPPAPDAIATAIISLLNDPQLPQYQQASRERVLSRHTPERFFDYILGVYQSALDST